MVFYPHAVAADGAEIAFALGEVRGQLKALTESVVSVRGQVDVLAHDLTRRLDALDHRVRTLERDVHLVTRVGAFLAAGVLAALGWLASALV